MNSYFREWGIISLFCSGLLFSGCASETNYAPVVSIRQQSAAKSGAYIVHKGDTIYSVAWAFGLDYREFARANGLKPPYKIYPGQRLHGLKQPPHIQTAAKPKTFRAKHMERVVKVYLAKKKALVSNPLQNRPTPKWVWPARGRIAQGFTSKLYGNHGIDISGRVGEPVHAAASGMVVYSGDGVRGYGNLLIIKHNDSYLSAYAYNKKLLVRIGEWVRVGQTIAEMGRNNAGRAVLHFEIRHNGKPVDPKHYLRS